MEKKVKGRPPESRPFVKRAGLKRAHIFVSGRVQGVFFRDSARREVLKLGIGGWVRNLEDGRVEAVFEGEKEKVEKMVNWAKNGPIFARVDKMEAEWQEYQGEFKSFEIR